MSTSALSHLSTQVMANPLNPDSLLSGKWALLVLVLVIFAECGLLIGFFLPGDTLLLAAGISIAIGRISTPFAWFLVLVPIAAIAGNLVGYGIGRNAGPKVFQKPDSAILRPENVERTHLFMERWGARAVIFGRFVPIVRTLITVAAGIGKMSFRRYAVYSVIGGIIWADGILLIGERLGHIKFVQDNKDKVDYLVTAVIVIALLPTIYHYFKSRRAIKARRAAAAASAEASPETSSES